ncbi:MAG: PAS domain-containing protein [Proteobacteria bacterium]|nr:PAS domain-containing protein [Pseudomonadota bacterium]
MQRFLLEQNVRHFQALLDAVSDASSRAVLSELLATAQSELALLEAMESGVRPSWWHRFPEQLQAEREALQGWFHSTFDGSDRRATLLDPGPGLMIVDVAGDLDLAPGRSRLELVGRHLFERLPENPTGSGAPSIAILYRAMRAAAETGLEQQIEPYRHDLLDGEGNFVERHWRGSCQPLHDGDGRLVLLLGLMEDITEQVCAR